MKQIDGTLRLLQIISNRLSGRDDCKDLEYVIEISNNGTHVVMIPPKHIYPDTYHRKETNKLLVTDYALLKLKESGYEKLSDGRYTYKQSVNKKSRRWTYL